MSSRFAFGIVLSLENEQESANTLNRMDALITDKFELKANKYKTRIMKSTINMVMRLSSK